MLKKKGHDRKRRKQTDLPRVPFLANMGKGMLKILANIQVSVPVCTMCPGSTDLG